VNAERIEQARRFGGELCDIDGCTEYGTLEHVRDHLADADRRRRAIASGGTGDEHLNDNGTIWSTEHYTSCARCLRNGVPA
jgi:hypothetical protein